MFPVIDGRKVWMASPEDYVVDFSNPQKDTTIINWIYIICIIGFLVSFIVAPCLCVVFYNHREWRLPSSIILLAYILTAAAQCLVLVCLHDSVLGVHIWEISLDDATSATTLNFVATLLFVPGTALARMALCITSYRLVTPKKWSQNAIRCTAGLLLGASVAICASVLRGYNRFRPRGCRCSHDPSTPDVVEEQSDYRRTYQHWPTPARCYHSQTTHHV
ncbi:hypothetical protein FPOAC2_14328 [Fusarium poae]